MTAKQIMDAAKTNLNLDDDCDTLLLYCLKNVINEVATEFVPVYAEETCVVTGGKVNLNELTKIPIRITSITSSQRNLDFSATPFGPKLDCNYDGIVTVTYSYLPLIESEEDEVPYGEPLLRALGFGLSAEYCLVAGPQEESEIWDMRYKDAIKEAAFARREYRIKPRAWY